MRKLLTLGVLLISLMASMGSRATDDRATSASPLLTPQELADLLGIPVATLAQWRYRRTGPPWVRVGKHCRYPQPSVDRWIADNTSTPQPA